MGANFGSKTIIFLKLGVKKIIAVEPDPQCVDVLRVRFQGNKKVEIVKAAVDNHLGESVMFTDRNNSAFNTLSEKWADSLRDGSAGRFEPMRLDSILRVDTTTLEVLIQKFGLPDAIKLDTEGYELQAMQTLRRGVRLIWFEANLPEFQIESIQCVELLMRLDPRYKFNYCVSTTESPKARLEFDEWADGPTMISILKKDSYRFMEVFAQLS